METGVRSREYSDDEEYPLAKRRKVYYTPATYRNVDCGAVTGYIVSLREELIEIRREISNLEDLASFYYVCDEELYDDEWQEKHQRMLAAASQTEDELNHENMIYHHSMLSPMLDTYLPPELTNIVMTCFPAYHEYAYEGP